MTGNRVKEAWKMIKSLKGTGSSREQESVPVKALLDHYSDLFSDGDTWEAQDMIGPTVGETVAELDNDITRGELVKVFRELKSGKAGGVDGICPEFVKSVLINKSFLDHVMRLFGLIFNGN